MLAVLAVALTATACGPDSLTHDDVAGCYLVEWTNLGGEPLSVVPDSVQLLLDSHVLWPEVSHLDTLDFRKAILFRQEVDSTLNYYGDVIWEDHWWWWLIVNDSVQFGTGHDGADWVGFRASLRGGELTGKGIRTTDYAPDSHFDVRGRRLACPEAAEQAGRREFVHR
jgi:hypothetical protein